MITESENSMIVARKVVDSNTNHVLLLKKCKTIIIDTKTW